MGTDDAAGRRLASQADDSPSLAERTLRRHTPEVGAVCGKAARTVLCGGRAMKRTSLPLQRRKFITLLGGAAATWSIAASAQPPTVPVIGYIHPTSPAASANLLAAFRNGLMEAGYVENQNIAIE